MPVKSVIWRMALVAALTLAVAGCGATPTPTPAPTPTATPTLKTYSAPPPMTIDPDKTYIATIETEKGTITLELFPKVAPQTVNSFVFLAREGYYDGTSFHRVIPDFMAQGGASQGDYGGPGYNLPAEFSDLKHQAGTLAMARAEDPNSAGSQFYICYEAQPSLDGQYTIFGQMIEGMDVLKALTARKPGDDTPGDVIISITIEEK